MKNLKQFDQTIVHIVTDDKHIFEGYCIYDHAEYNLHEFNREEDSLRIDDWTFYESEIVEVKPIKEKDIYIFDNRNEHQMTLYPSPFEAIEKGYKNIELRLYDEKRKVIKPQDLIRFENRKDESDVLRVLVEEIYIYDSFKELYESLPLLECGYTEETIKNASYKDMEQYYSKEDLETYPACGIRISIYEGS